MKKFLKTVVALSVCLSGWALVPLTSLPTQAFGWELFAEAYGEIFSDGFETGDTSRWSRVVGEVLNIEASDAEAYAATLRIDGANWESKDQAIVTLAAGLSERHIPTFKVEARRRGGHFEVRARAVAKSNVWVESPWRAVDRDYETIEVEWRRALDKTEDGLLYVSVDGRLLLWLVDLDNSRLPLRTVQLDMKGGRPVATLSPTEGVVD